MAALTRFDLPNRLPPCARRAFLALTGVALTIYFYSPVREVMKTLLDTSNYASYAYFTAHGFQYGPEVVPMAGPYGFVMYGWVYSGELFKTRALCELGLCAALAALTLWFFVRNRGSWWRWAWLAAHVAFTPFIEDLPIEWTLLLAGLFLLQIPSGRGFSLWAIPAAGLLAFLSLGKGTHLVLALATLGVIAFGYAWQQRWKQLLLILSSYLVLIVSFWALAGQNILNLPAYVRGIGELASGYNDAMSLEEPASLFFRGALTLVGLAFGVAWALWTHRRDTNTVASLALFAGFAFVQWKHGFVRADGHAYIFFHYAIVAAIATYLAGHTTREMHWRRVTNIIGIGTMLATLLICFYGSEVMLPNVRRTPRLIGERWSENLHQLLNLPKVKSAFDQRLADQSRLHALPLTRHEVGRHTIDLFGFEHGLIPLNGMTYHPRPMGGGAFNVYTPALMQLNRDFLRDPTRRPDYYLLRIQTVDDRLPTQDDGLALTDLLYRYQPILVEHDHLLLKALAQPVSPIPRLLSRQTFKFGDIVPVPAVGSHELLFARFDISPNFLGRVLAAFYKLPRVKIGLVGQNIAQPEARRIVPAMAGSPFILGPVIENTRDWLGLFTDQPGKSLSTFRISTRDRTWFRKTIQVEFYAMPRPTAPQQSVINELLPFTETAIEAVSTVLPSGKPDKLIGLLMHPPSKLSWSLKGDERSLSFGYGLVPAAYLEGHTDGVEFIANLQRAGHPSLELFRRLLDPVARKTDQGHHPTEVILPVLPPGTRVVMTVNPGPHGNSAWDWAYISALQFKYGEYPAGQFPGFNVVPVAVETNVNPISEVDGKRFFMLHAPSALTFALKGNEHSLQIDFGLLSGAYTGDGHTEGVDYAVEIVRAGQPTREIFRRDLRPLTVPTDRGQQHADISLPDLKQGDQLILRTSAGPTGSVSWGWAYLERLHLE